MVATAPSAFIACTAFCIVQDPLQCACVENNELWRDAKKYLPHPFVLTSQFTLPILSLAFPAYTSLKKTSSFIHAPSTPTSLQMLSRFSPTLRHLSTKPSSSKPTPSFTNSPLPSPLSSLSAHVASLLATAAAKLDSNYMAITKQEHTQATRVSISEAIANQKLIATDEERNKALEQATLLKQAREEGREDGRSEALSSRSEALSSALSSARSEASLELSSAEEKYNQKLAAAVAEAEDAIKRRFEHLAAQRAGEAHPTLGVPLVDLGHKQVYLVNGQSLANMPVWEKQRIYRHDRAEIIAADIMKKNPKKPHYGLPGVITLLQEDDGLKVLDGQHRVGAIAVISAAMKKDPDADFGFDINKILVEVFKRPPQPNADSKAETAAAAASSSYAKELFNAINSAVPVKYIDTPDVASADEKAPYDEACDQLNKEYPEMFKPTHRCRPPHVHIDSLRDDMYQANVMGNFKLSSPEDLLNWMTNQNTELGKRVTNEKKKNHIKLKKAIFDKAVAHNFYLGVTKSWMHK